MKIAILGAESTGKTQLAQALVSALSKGEQRAVWLPESLREWCDQAGRPPRAHEQAAIAAEQMRRVAAAPACDFLLADTTALMTAIYSDLLFDDPSLYAAALAHHHQYDLTLVTGLDLDWVADGIQRDGPAMRAQVNTRLRQVLATQGLSYAVVYGQGATRAEGALQAIAHRSNAPLASAPARSTPWTWTCDNCSDAQCEHRLFTGHLKLGQT